MTDVRTLLVEAIADHASGEDGCICGEDDHLAFDYWARHVADVLLSLPSIAIVELPEVDDADPDGLEWYSDGSDAGTVGAYPGIKVVWGTWEWTPEQARVVAAQWLAAANAAEVQR